MEERRAYVHCKECGLVHVAEGWKHNLDRTPRSQAEHAVARHPHLERT
jgi:uncharacterized Zn finger protein